MSKVQPPRGFRDFDPALKRQKEDLLARIRVAYRRFGFDEIETPVAEALDRLRSSEGGENVGMIFQIMRRGLTTGHLREATDPSELCDLGLRYDLTVPLARFFASQQGRLPGVLRAIQIGPVWRAERPQKGRYRQFTQCDIDIIGEASTLAEIELIIATLAALESIGLRGAVVRLNDRRLLDALLANANVLVADRPRALIVIDKLDKIGSDGVSTALAEFLPHQVTERLTSSLRTLSSGAANSIDEFADTVGISEPSDAMADHRSIIAAVRSVCGANSIRFDPTLVRGLGYYTGPIFEIEHPSSQSSVAGGGRYDNMIGKFLGQSVPACGFSLGFDRLLEIAGEGLSSTDQRIALIYEDGAAELTIFQRQQQLLTNGYSVRLVRASRKNMKRVFDELATGGYQRFQRLTEPVTVTHDVSREE